MTADLSRLSLMKIISNTLTNENTLRRFVSINPFRTKGSNHFKLKSYQISVIETGKNNITQVSISVKNRRFLFHRRSSLQNKNPWIIEIHLAYALLKSNYKSVLMVLNIKYNCNCKQNYIISPYANTMR